ncbi:MAG: hypothetical protein QG597_189 [Actinomycetota bacterium]|nr:hypothetical protein [Actinomycetota bacterium]
MALPGENRTDTPLLVNDGASVAEIGAEGAASASTPSPTLATRQQFHREDLKVKRTFTLAISTLLTLAAIGLSGSTAQASTPASASNVHAAKTSRACIGMRYKRFANSDRLTVTTRLYPVFRGGNPPGPYTSASVWYNNTRSPYNYGQPGMYVDLFHVPAWRITGLIVKVSSSELVYGGKVYACPNKFYR